MEEREQKYASDEDIALYKKAEAEIESETAIFSFDIKTLTKRVRDDDPSQAFIQAHLYLDHILSRLLTENVPFPRFLQLDRSGFSQKIQLVEALGLLPHSFVGTIKVINSIRNRIAHQLDYEVTEADIGKLRSTIAKDATKNPDGTDTALPELLRLIAVIMDLHRQKKAFERVMRRKAVARARVVLDGILIDEVPPAGG